MSTKHHELPECGILPDDAFDDIDQWLDAMRSRRENLVDETAAILSSSESADDAAVALNRLYAPFNTYDKYGAVANHLVARTHSAVPSAAGPEKLELQYHDGDFEPTSPMDSRVLVRRDGVWWFEDADPPRDAWDATTTHENAAYRCLDLVWWGSEEKIAAVAGYKEELQGQEMTGNTA
ncbi:MAG: hypothetical protein ACOCV2_11590 [Persicimonas sp.]